MSQVFTHEDRIELEDAPAEEEIAKRGHSLEISADAFPFLMMWGRLPAQISEIGAREPEANAALLETYRAKRGGLYTCVPFTPNRAAGLTIPRQHLGGR